MIVLGNVRAKWSRARDDFRSEIIRNDKGSRRAKKNQERRRVFHFHSPRELIASASCCLSCS